MPPTGRVTSRRPASLTTDEFVQGALRVIREVGADRLTMRQLAEELGVTPMAAYRYVQSKEQLLDLALAAALRDEQLALGVDEAAGWEAHVRGRVFATFRALAKYPGLASFALARPMSPSARENAERAVGVLESAGLSRADAELANATIHTYSFGLAGMETAFRPRKRRDATRSILVDVEIDTFVDFGLDLLIEGIRAKIGRPA